MEIKKSFGVRGADDMAVIWIQELIMNAVSKGPVGTVKIDTEKIEIFKFGIKLFTYRFAPNSLACNEGGIILFKGMFIPKVRDYSMVKLVDKSINC